MKNTGLVKPVFFVEYRLMVLVPGWNVRLYVLYIVSYQVFVDGGYHKLVGFMAQVFSQVTQESGR